MNVKLLGPANALAVARECSRASRGHAQVNPISHAHDDGGGSQERIVIWRVASHQDRIARWLMDYGRDRLGPGDGNEKVGFAAASRRPESEYVHRFR